MIFLPLFISSQEVTTDDISQANIANLIDGLSQEIDSIGPLPPEQSFTEETLLNCAEDDSACFRSI